MARTLRLFPSAAAAAERAAELPDGEARAGDLEQGFAAFCAEAALPARAASLPVRRLLAHAAALHAGIEVAPAGVGPFADALSLLHGSGLSPDALDRATRGGPWEGAARRMALGLRAHLALLEETRLLDPGALPLAAAGGSPGWDRVIVEPRAAWTQAEVELCRALARTAELELRLPEDPSRPELFSPLEAAHQELHREGGLRVVGVDPAEAAEPPLRASLGAAFSARSAPGPIDVFRAGTLEDEAREIARRVRALVAAGVPADEIAVAGGREPIAVVSEALLRAGLPRRGAPGRSLAATPAGAAALALLELAEHGIAREPLCRLLAAGLLPLGGVPGGRGRGVRVAKWLREAGARDHASGALLPPLRDLLARRRPGGEPPWAEEALAALERAVETLAALPAEATFSRHARALWKAFVELGAAAAARASWRMPLEAGEPLAAQAAGRRAVDQIEETLGELARERPGAWPTLAQAEASAQLRALFAETPSGAGADAAAGVWLGSVAGRIGLRSRHLFLVGLDERPPPPDPTEPFLPAALREALAAAVERPLAFPPSGRAARERLERLRFLLACCSATEGLTASAPRLGARGEPLAPSPWLIELCRAVGREGPEELRAGRRPRGAACLDRLEVAAAHLGEPPFEAAEPALAAEVRELRERERSRREAIRARRAAPTNGRLADPALREPLARLLAFPPEKPLSASTLDRLAACGFRAFAEKLLRVLPPTERGDELEAREAGSVRHRALRAAFEALRRERLLPLQGGARRGRELDVMLAAARAELDLAEREAPTGHPVAWRAERASFERRLVRIHDRELGDPGWLPERFELSFGAGPPREGAPPPSEPALPPLPLELESGPAALGGAIDRVDVQPGALRVIDYKSGRADGYQKRLLRGLGETQLQLLVYALLARERLAPGAKVDAAYLSIEDGELTKGVEEICGAQRLELGLLLSLDPRERARARAEGRPNLLARIEELVGAARRGELPATPGHCRGCDYVAACRVGPDYAEEA